MGKKNRLKGKKRVVVRDPSLRLKRLIEKHPSPEVSQELFQLIDSGKVSVNFQSIATQKNAQASVAWISVQGVGLVLTLIVPSDWLMGSAVSVKKKKLVIFHEYQHIKQQLSGRYPRKLAFGIDMTRLSSLPSSEVRVWFDSEYEAYEAECKLAIELGWQKVFPWAKVFQSGGRQDLRRTIARRFAMEPAYRCHADLFLRLGEE